MYRGGRTQRPVSNPREHIQRNQYARTSLQRRKLFHSPRFTQSKFFYLLVACFVIGSIYYLGSSIGHSTGPSQYNTIVTGDERHSGISSNKQTATNQVTPDHHEEVHPIDPDDVPKHYASLESAPYDEFKCSFREYKPHRYYPVDDLTEKFLSDAEYIRGELPFVINPRTSDPDGGKADDSSSYPKKLCTDTSEWEQVLPNHRPFSDGQNPSFVSLAHDAYGKVSDQPRIERITIQPLAEIYGEEALENLYLGLLLFGDSQCRWNMTKEELEGSKSSPLQKAPSKRTLVVILNEHLDPIGRAVLELEHDAPWGDKRNKHGVKKQIDGKGYDTSIVELDDARLFFHNGRLHVLYRNGPSFGYEKQIQNPIHLEKISDTEFKAVIKASESFSVCCGRNIAFISEVPSDKESGSLQALTWVDPVTTEAVDHPSVDKRRLMDASYLDHGGRRRLGNTKGSSIHGTNGYLIPLHGTNELLGVAHFHRPEHRKESDYAKHGHHYTHAFFTLEQKQVSKADGSSVKKFALKRLSDEFVFMAPSSRNEHTGDVIQFASGLDLVGSDKDGKLMVSYGINDCEAAIVFFAMEKVQALLLPVEEGTEVVHLMKKLT